MHFKLLVFVCCFIAFSSFNEQHTNYIFSISSAKWEHDGSDSLIEVTTIIKNNSQDTLVYKSEAGGWEDYYLVDNEALEVYLPRNAFTGEPFIVRLPPGKSRMVFLPLRLKHGVNSFDKKFKIGMILRLKQANLTLVESLPHYKPKDELQKEERDTYIVWSNGLEL